MTAAKQKIEFLDLKTYQEDPSNVTLVFHEEDHTIGNALKHIICGMPDVEFCGYSVPHPLEDKILFRVQTHRQKDALQVILKGLDELEKVFAVIQHKFEEKKAAHDESSS